MAASPSPTKTPKRPAIAQTAKADWCVCTIPLSILSQIPINVGAPHESGDRCGALCVGRQDRPAVQAPVLGGRRRYLWRHQLHRSADPADRLSEYGFQSRRPGRLARRLHLRGIERLRVRLDAAGGTRCARGRLGLPHSSAIRGRVRERHRGGVASGAVHARLRRLLDREDARAEHYDDLCQIDGRIVLAGEHASYLPAWQEGAILSSLDAITRLHDRVVKT